MVAPVSPLLTRHDEELMHIERARFFADLNDLELRLAVIDVRFERFATLSDENFQSWRRDTASKARSLATRAHSFEDVGRLEPHHRRRVAAVLVTIRSRVGALDERRRELLGR
ncbi:hypothetical protein BJY17_001906 [Agromyces hippuratus]|uniref:Uncharacterized protein n=1 Tax=Agromyces hippuratus TaxID=286438 RepID=A0A852WT80_9MICO|nr:hypothetical protein [Agromyces hippuratus]NYG21159.1 hypothetical protein [Agromyces hippuratus]